MGQFAGPGPLRQSDMTAVEPHADNHYDGALDALDLTQFKAFTDVQDAIAALSGGFRLAQLPVYGAVTGATMGTSMGDVVTQDITTNGGVVVVFGWAKALASTGLAAGIVRTQYALRVGATDLVAPDPIDNTKDGSTSGGLGQPPQPFMYVDTSGFGVPGTYTYKIRGAYTALGTTISACVGNGALVLVELEQN